MAHAWLKAVGCTVAIGAFFIAYFHVMNNPLFPVRIMSLSAPDRWVPVLPFSVWIYFTLWIYICLPPSLMLTWQALGHYLLGAVALSLLGLAVFILLPTTVPEWNYEWTRHPALAFLKESDATGNACPSLHVGFAVYAGQWASLILKRLQAPSMVLSGNALWCGAIVLSTMSTKQHVFIDVITGVMLGACVFRGSRWWVNRLNVEV